MTTRLTALAIAIFSVLTLGVGAALAVPHGGIGGWMPHEEMPHEAMHASASMRAVHEQMPADLQAECDVMHAQMSSGMGSPMGQMHTSPYRR